MDLSIIPECYVDTNLIETIVPPNNRYNHQKGCGTVAKVMKERFRDNFALGIVDKDKKEIEYLKEFTEIYSKGKLVLHKHLNRNHYIIQIFPAVERFILDAIETTNLDLTQYDLPSSFDAFKKATKTANSKEDRRFKRLFKDLQRAGGTELETLASWIRYIKENRYNIDLEAIKNL